MASPLVIMVCLWHTALEGIGTVGRCWLLVGARMIEVVISPEWRKPSSRLTLYRNVVGFSGVALVVGGGLVLIWWWWLYGDGFYPLEKPVHCCVEGGRKGGREGGRKRRFNFCAKGSEFVVYKGFSAGQLSSYCTGGALRTSKRHI